MRGVLSLVVAGVVSLTLGVLGSVALAASLTKSASDAAETDTSSTTVPGVYGSR